MGVGGGGGGGGGGALITGILWYSHSVLHGCGSLQSMSM